MSRSARALALMRELNEILEANAIVCQPGEGNIDGRRVRLERMEWVEAHMPAHWATGSLYRAIPIEETDT